MVKWDVNQIEYYKEHIEVCRLYLISVCKDYWIRFCCFWFGHVPRAYYYVECNRCNKELRNDIRSK